MSFGTSVELNVGMALSWLPLIADYTRHVEKEKSGTLISVLGYFFGSILMFVIGLGASLYAGTTDIASILLSAGGSGGCVVYRSFCNCHDDFFRRLLCGNQFPEYYSQN